MGRWAVSTLQQSLHGFRDIAILDRREYFAEEYERVREEIGRTRYLRQLLGDVPRVALETGLVLFVALLVAGWAVAGPRPEDSFAVLGMFAYAALRVLPSVSRVVLQLNELRFGSASAATVHKDLIATESAAASVPRVHRGEPLEPVPLRRSIRLEQVSYRYPGADRNAVDGVDVEIGTGESIGIVGPTGGGKSTLIDLVLGLLSPDSGRVLVDDSDIHTQLDGWQRNLGVVPQAVYLLDSTLRRNIALGVADDAIDDARVQEAIRLAQLEPFVAALPKGLDTAVGERGVRLSGGERQRVAIARALYRRPAVIVFDEGTSALDNETESELLRALASLRRGRTLLIVAHRLTTVRDCDRILVVDGGRIIDQGTFDGLIDRSPAFRRLAAAGRLMSDETVTTSTSA
jgi:ATP-binding cassette subfamily C protein